MILFKLLQQYLENRQFLDKYGNMARWLYGIRKCKYFFSVPCFWHKTSNVSGIFWGPQVAFHYSQEGSLTHTWESIHEMPHEEALDNFTMLLDSTGSNQIIKGENFQPHPETFRKGWQWTLSSAINGHCFRQACLFRSLVTQLSPLS